MNKSRLGRTCITCVVQVTCFTPSISRSALWMTDRTGNMAFPFFTICHSTRPVSEFVDLLESQRVRCVVTVRTIPRSRPNPQYIGAVLAEALAPRHVGYECIAALGGLLGRKHDISPSVNAFWQNQSFHNYADYA